MMTSRTEPAEKKTTCATDRVAFVGVPVDHLSQPDNFNLEQFEYQVTQPDTESAARMLLFVLTQLDCHYGQWGPQFSAYTPGTSLEGLNPVLCTRIAGAVTTLFSRPDFTVSDGGYVQLMNLHRWLALIFAVSLYRHADHIIRNINAAGGGVVDPLTLTAITCVCSACVTSRTRRLPCSRMSCGSMTAGRWLVFSLRLSVAVPCRHLPRTASGSCCWPGYRTGLQNWTPWIFCRPLCCTMCTCTAPMRT